MAGAHVSTSRSCNQAQRNQAQRNQAQRNQAQSSAIQRDRTCRGRGDGRGARGTHERPYALRRGAAPSRSTSRGRGPSTRPTRRGGARRDWPRRTDLPRARSRCSRRVRWSLRSRRWAAAAPRGLWACLGALRCGSPSRRVAAWAGQVRASSRARPERAVDPPLGPRPLRRGDPLAVHRVEWCLCHDGRRA